MDVRKGVMVGVSLLALATGAPALAQEAPGSARPETGNTLQRQDGTEPSGPQDAGEQRSDEIIVTASRRAQTLQDTPIAVSVTSAETIEEAQIRDLIDLQSVVPSLRVQQSNNSGATNFFIRGFGNGANNPGIEPSVGVFVDGVYRSRSAAQITDLPNIERIEVLRGPQSTLFGKNASAGVISVVTQKPQFEFSGSAQLVYGNFDQKVAKADVTGPIIADLLAFSLAGNYNKRDGYFRVVNLDNARINDRDRWDARAQLLFTPGEDLEIRLIGDYSKIDELCCGTANLLYGPTAPALNALAGTVAVVPNAPFADRTRLNRLPTNDIENYGGSGHIDYTLGNVTLSSITAYRELRSRTVDDGDFTQVDIIGSATAVTKIDTFTQELRATSNFDGPVNFLLGGYYFDEDIDFTNTLALGADARRYVNLLAGGSPTTSFLNTIETLTGNPAGSFFATGTGISDAFTLKNRSYSAFGTVDFKPFDRLTLTGGFNYTKDKKDATSNVVATERFSAVDLVALGVRIGVPATAAATSANPLLALQPLQFLPPFLNFPNAVEDGRTRDSDWSYTLRAAFEVNDRLNVYATYATGFKASSFNLSRDARPTAADFIPGSPAQRPVPGASPIRDAGLALPNLTTGSRFAGPEESTVYELGIKGNYRVATFNFAVFQQEIEGFQENTFTGRGYLLTNAGKQSTFGFEFEGTVTPVDPLTLFLAVTYLDPKFDSFVQSPFGDISGQAVEGVSPLTTSAGFSFSHEFSDRVRLNLRGDYRFESETQVENGLPGFVQRLPSGAIDFAPALAIGRRFRREVNEFNASATLQLNERLEISAYGRNLSNNRYVTAILDGVAQTGSVFGYPNQPRTYGGAVRFKF